MTLDILANLDRDAAVALLLAASAATGPIKAAREANLSTDVLQLLKEIKLKQGLDPDDSSPRAAEVVDDQIANALETAIFETVSIEEIKELMADDGSLRASDHDIVFTDDSNIIGEEERALALYIIANPTMADFIAPPGDVRNANKVGPYVFLRRSGIEPYNPWYMIFAVKQRAKLQVQFVFNIFPETVDLRDVHTARDALVRFAEHYGVDMSLPDGDTTRIIINRYADSNDESYLPDSYDPELYPVIGAEYKCHIDGLQAELIIIAVRFYFDHERYEADMSKYSIE